MRLASPAIENLCEVLRVYGPTGGLHLLRDVGVRTSPKIGLTRSWLLATRSGRSVHSTLGRLHLAATRIRLPDLFDGRLCW